eukprot:CAMPEP_0178982268 /NCGR_PEP_ID=MMETSP0795-20121207/405_1 /TAXON_ID=88552 /ORGANISM="Amoebophrya sp., Strain Ameob2" /LENGTH=154 /DNA_ID=CAMNT_0020672901 /DNA_START=570 /DNA_END=1031 /DNA_ORIENTATION=-
MTLKDSYSADDSAAKRPSRAVCQNRTSRISCGSATPRFRGKGQWQLVSGSRPARTRSTPRRRPTSTWSGTGTAKANEEGDSKMQAAKHVASCRASDTQAELAVPRMEVLTPFKEVHLHLKRNYVVHDTVSVPPSRADEVSLLPDKEHLQELHQW